MTTEWPAPPDPVTIEYANVVKEKEHKVLIRWTVNPWANYSDAAQYQLLVRDVQDTRFPIAVGWIELCKVTTEITG